VFGGRTGQENDPYHGHGSFHPFRITFMKV
jgi:hypothetical protein